jgi:hypothetical protein
LGGADIEFAAMDDDDQLDQLDPVAWIVRVERERIDRCADAPFFQRDDGSALTRQEVERRAWCASRLAWWASRKIA